MKAYHFILLLPGMVLMSGCGKSEAEPAAMEKQVSANIIAVATAPVTRQKLDMPVKVTGVVSSSQEGKPSFKIGGVIERMLVEEGDAVKAGQTLATLIRTEIDAQVQQAETALAKARRDLERVKNLYADSVATLEQLQNASTGVTMAEEAVRIAAFNRDYTTVKAPISGKILKKLVQPGEIVGPGMPVYFILGTAASDWVIKAGLSDRDWARVRTGDPVLIRLDAYPGQTFQGKVTQLADVGNPASGTFDVEIAIQQQGKRLAAGLIASLEIQTADQPEQTIIPVEALVESNGAEASVFVLDGRNARLRKVQLSGLKGHSALVSNGLEEAETVITLGAQYLHDGQEVSVNGER